jgi:hypothetical protein
VKCALAKRTNDRFKEDNMDDTKTDTTRAEYVPIPGGMYMPADVASLWDFYWFDDMGAPVVEPEPMPKPRRLNPQRRAAAKRRLAKRTAEVAR